MCKLQISREYSQFSVINYTGDLKGLYFEMDLNAAGLVIADLCVRNMHVELI